MDGTHGEEEWTLKEKVECKEDDRKRERGAMEGRSGRDSCAVWNGGGMEREGEYPLRCSLCRGTASQCS